MRVRQETQSKSLAERLQTPGAMAFGVLLYALLLFLPHALLLPYADEILVVYPAKLMAQGWVVYKDFFTGVTPGSYVLAMLIFKLTGYSVVAIRCAGFFIALLTLAMVMQVCRRALHPWLRVLLAVYLMVDVLCHQYVYTHHTLSGPLSVWAIYALWRYLTGGRVQRAWVRLAGALLGVVLMSTQSTGVVMGGGLWVWLVWDRWRQQAGGLQGLLKAVGWAALNLLGPMVLVTGVFLGWLWWQGALWDFYQDTIAWLFYGGYQKVSSNLYFATGFTDIQNTSVIAEHDGTRRILPWMFPASVGQFLRGWLPVLGYLFATQRLAEQALKKRWQPTDDRWLLWVWGGWCLLISTLTYSSVYHIVTTGWMGFGFAAIALQTVTRRWGGLVRRTLAALAAVYLLYIIGLQTWISWSPLLTPGEDGKLNKYWVQSQGTAEPFLVDVRGPYNAFLLTMMTQLTQKLTTPGDRIFAISDLSELYLVSDRLPASGHLIVYPVMLSPQEEQKMVATLKADPPKIIFYDHKDVWMVKLDFRYKALRDNPPNLDALHAFLSANYQAYPLDRKYSMLVRRSDLQGRTLQDLLNN
ncbi:MAG: ArnT family glycosyltransferase [Candidatus Melainabacteria bacterium]